MTEKPKLYHYTDKPGLMGMAEHKTLWMTNVLYMNDSEEFNYGLNTVKKFINDNYDKSLGRCLNDPELVYAKNPSLFSFSLSENDDVLSQWRGYCPNGGFSISFDEQLLNDFINKNKLRIQRCIYDNADIEDYIINTIVRMTPEDYHQALKRPWYNKGLERMPFNLVSNVFLHIPFIKHSKFSEEKEWRIVNREHHERPLDQLNFVKYRKGKYDEKTPYLEYSLDGYGGDFITEATLFPGDNQTLAIEDVKSIVKSNNVKHTAIPYRP